MWAIKPNNVGQKVSARSIKSGWSMSANETFTCDHWDKSLVLDETSLALRSQTQEEIDKEIDEEALENLRAAAVHAETELILTGGTTDEAIAYQDALA